MFFLFLTSCLKNVVHWDVCVFASFRDVKAQSAVASRVNFVLFFVGFVVVRFVEAPVVRETASLALVVYRAIVALSPKT